VVGAQLGLMDDHGPLVQGAGAVEVSLVMQDGGEVVEALGGVGVVGSQAALVDGQGPLEQGRAPSRSPWSARTLARLSRLVAVSGRSAHRRAS